VAKAKKSKSSRVQHTWKVTRTNTQSINVTADSLSVVDGDLVFTANGVAVRVIAANTYSDVELIAGT
jgi:hypothetical protein